MGAGHEGGAFLVARQDEADAVLPLAQRFVARWTRGIPAEDLATTLRTLRALYRNLEA